MVEQTYLDGDPRITERLVGTPGGLFGEFLNLLATLEELLGTKLENEKITDLLTAFVSGYMKQETFDFCNITQADLNQLL